MANQNEAKHQFDKDNVYLCRMLDLIPPNFYFDESAQKFLNDDSEESCTEEPKSTSKEGKKIKKIKDAKKAKAKKLASFDPDKIRTVTSVTEMIASKKEKNENGIKSKKSAHKNAKTAKKKSAKQEKLQKKLSAPANTHEELLDRLRAKIDLLREKRKALGLKDDIQKKRLKRQESKTKLQIKKKQDKKIAKGPPNGMLTPQPKKPVPKRPVFNKEGDMVFSKFDFMEKKAAKTDKKNYKRLLEKAQQNKEKLTALSKEDSTKAEKMKQKQQWQNVLQKAEGIKVKDNPELIKKSMKKREKRKEKSKKDWKDREEKVEKKMKQRQDKRKTNIKKKKESRINTKISKSKKKGRVPGF